MTATLPISVKIPGIDRMKADLSRRVHDGALRALTISTLKVHKDATRLAPANLGTLRASIQFEIDQDALRSTIVPVVKYAAPVEFGSRPHWAPIKPLLAWAKAKFGDESIAYAVQKAIAKRGTKAQPFMIPALQSNVQFIVDTFAREIAKAVGS